MYKNPHSPTVKTNGSLTYKQLQDAFYKIKYETGYNNRAITVAPQHSLHAYGAAMEYNTVDVDKMEKWWQQYV